MSDFDSARVGEYASADMNCAASELTCEQISGPTEASVSNQTNSHASNQASSQAVNPANAALAAQGLRRNSVLTKAALRNLLRARGAQFIEFGGLIYDQAQQRVYVFHGNRGASSFPAHLQI